MEEPETIQPNTPTEVNILNKDKRKRTYIAYLKQGYYLRCKECHHNIYLYTTDYNKDTDTITCRHCNTTNKVYATKKRIREVTKRKVGDNEIMNRYKIIKLVERFEDAHPIPHRHHVMYVAFVCTLFLTGSRISEVLGIPKKEVKRKRLKIYDVSHWKSKPLTREQVEITNDKKGRKVMIFHDIPVLKKKLGYRINMEGKEVMETKYRDVVIPFDFESFFTERIEKWIRINRIDLDWIIFPFRRANGFKFVNKEFGNVFPHFFRHCRASDLVNTYGFGHLPTKKFFEWKSSDHVDRYAHIGSTELNNLMFNNMPGNVDSKKVVPTIDEVDGSEEL